MRKAADAFRSIGEVSQLVGVPPHVLRYWETQFPQLAPVKRADGRRYYRPEDLHLAAGICELLREEGMTTRGAARLIARDKGAEVRARGRARLPERFHDGTETTAAVAEGAPPAAEPEAIDAMGDVTDRATPDPSGTAALPETDVSLASPLPMKGAQEPTPRPDEPETAASVKHDELPVDRLTKGSASEAPIAADEPSSGIAAAPPVEADPAGALPDAGTFPEVAAMPPTSRPAKPFPDNTVRSASAHEPTADDLPLFPGLAHAAPPPGVWLPRLAAIAATLREMPPPRRPKARMQQLRDRLGALINDDP